MAEPRDIHRLVVEHALDLVGVLDRRGRLVYASPAHGIVLGHPPATLLGTDPLDLVHPEDREAARAAFASGHVAPPVRMRRGDGSWPLIEAQVSPVPGEDLRIFVGRDVTGRLRAERRRDAQYAVTRLLAEAQSLPDAAVAMLRTIGERLDWDAGVLWQGDGIRRALWHADGLGVEDVAALTRFTGLPERVRTRGEPEWVPDVLSDRGAGPAAPGRLRAAVAVPVGGWGVLEMAGRKRRGADADRLRLFASFGRQLAQFLDRTRAQAELRDSRTLLAAVVEGTTDAVFVKDLRGRYLLINEAGARALGHPVAAILGADDRAFLPPEASQEVMARDRAVIESGAPDTVEQVVPLERGSRRFLVTKAPYRDDAGRVLGVIGIAHDITEHRRLEIELRQAQKMEAIGRLAGGVAHDFNNILAVIRGFGDLIRRRLSAADPTVDEWLRHMSEATARGTALTSQLLAFGRREPLESEVLEVNAVVAGIDPLLRRVLGEDLRLVTVFGASPGTVEMNRGQLEQVVMNLAVNARDAMPDGGKLTIETAEVPVDVDTASRLGLQSGPHVLLRVSDTGTGMDEETRSRVFEPFFTTKGTGTGLGLATVYGIVTQAGGHIGVQSSPGQGAVFLVHLPAAQALTGAAREHGHGDAAEPASTGTVLVAEDEEDLLELLRSMLHQAGYSVLAARSGEEALELATEHAGEIDALVTDVVMRGLRGPDLAARVRAGRPGLRVVFVTGYGEQPSLPSVQPGDAVLAKPFALADLLDALGPAAGGQRRTAT